jgi:glycosyltransferase involved in cell wall biosynthesis
MPKISVVSPVYGCKSCLNDLYARLLISLEKITSDFEIILVNDGGPDNAWPLIKEISQKDNRVKGIDFSRNFGQHYAITAGLEYATGEWVVVMDCDLQDQPEEILKLYTKSQEGYDVVLAQRYLRQDSFFKKMFSKLFYKTLGYLTETGQDSSVANFGIYHKNVITAILSMRDSIKYFPAMVKWVGFRSIGIPIEHAEREIGSSSYNFKRLFKLAIDTILSFSDKPLRLTIKFGFIISLLAFIFAIVELILSFTGNISVTGWASLIISIWFLSGIIIIVLGVVGLYIGKTFDRVKDRPVYILREKIGF